MFIRGAAVTPNHKHGGSWKAEPRKVSEVEDAMLENIDLKNKILRVAEQLMPFLEDEAKVGDVLRMIERAAPVAVIRLIDSVVHGKGKQADSAAKELLHMAGYKPVERSVNVHENVDRMSEQQLDGFLQNAFKGMKDSEKQALVKMIETKDGTYIPMVIGKEEP